MDKNTIIGIAGLIIAIISLFFGDNLYEQIKGHSFFSVEPSASIATHPPSDFNASKLPTNTPTTEKLSSDLLKTIRATKAEINFFESDGDLPPLDKRIYTNEFNSKTVKTICWSLTLEYHTFWGNTDFQLRNVTYRSDGSIFSQSTSGISESLPSFVDSYVISSSYPFALDSDTYTLVLYADNVEFARASFTVK